MLVYLSFVLAIFSMVFAGIIGRTDVYILSLGVGMVAYGLNIDLPMVLLLASISAFLGAYLPFGITSGTVIQGFEGFANKKDTVENFDPETKEEEFEDKEEEFEDKEEEFEDKKEEEEFEDKKEEEEFEDKKAEEEFEDKEEEFEDKEEEGFEDKEEEFEDKEEEFEDKDEEGFEEDEVEGFRNAKASDKNGFEGFANPKKSKKHRPPPDNGSRAEMFQLGKKYKMPKETDDAEYHLDAGTTFLNAYKSLKPDQINAMTKDTQELINTQKQLMSTLNTLKPLITDGKQMMDTFQNYFGAGGLEGMGNLGAMADKFAGK